MRNAPTIRKFLSVHTNAIAWLSAPGHRSKTTDMMVSVSNPKREDVEKSYDFLVGGRFFEPTGAVSRAHLAKVVSALQELGDIPAGFGTDRLFLPEVTPVTD